MGAPELANRISVRQVAKTLGCTEQHVYSLIREGALDAINIGSTERPSYRITEDAVRAFIKARTVQPATTSTAA